MHIPFYIENECLSKLYTHTNKHTRPIYITSINIIKFNQNNAAEMLINDFTYSYLCGVPKFTIHLKMLVGAAAANAMWNMMGNAKGWDAKDDQVRICICVNRNPYFIYYNNNNTIIPPAIQSQHHRHHQHPAHQKPIQFKTIFICKSHRQLGILLFYIQVLCILTQVNINYIQSWMFILLDGGWHHAMNKKFTTTRRF